MNIQISKDQNRVWIDGNLFSAKEKHKDHTCGTCFFIEKHEECHGVPCMNFQRIDKKSVFFEKVIKSRPKIKIQYGTSIFEVKNGKDAEIREWKKYYHWCFLGYWRVCKIKFKCSDGIYR